jgi:hypothetical protein
MNKLERIRSCHMKEFQLFHNNKIIFHLAVGLLLSCILSSVAWSAESEVIATIPKSKYRAPYPFTADAIWNDFLKLAVSPDGYVTKEQVESAYGVKLPAWHDSPRYFYLAYSSDASIARRNSMFGFDWGQVADAHGYHIPNPVGMCITITQVNHSLFALGWEKVQALHNTDRPYQDTVENVFIKGEYGQINIDSDGDEGCIASISMTLLPFGLKPREEYIHHPKSF